MKTKQNKAKPGGMGWGGRREGGSGGRTEMCSCGWFMLMCGRDQQNIAMQSSSSRNDHKKIKIKNKIIMCFRPFGLIIKCVLI